MDRKTFLEAAARYLGDDFDIFEEWIKKDYEENQLFIIENYANCVTFKTKEGVVLGMAYGAI